VGCGTGALTAAILTHCEPLSILGIDPSPAYIAWATANIQDGRARFETGDATRLTHSIADVVVSGLVLNFVPQPLLALAAMQQAAPDGLVAAYVWDYADRMELMRHFWDAAIALDPNAADLDEGKRFQICCPAPLAALWQEVGFIDVTTRAIDVPTVFHDFDDYWNPFLGGQAPAPSYAMSLDEEHRNALRDRIRAELPISSDGSIHLIARAWAVQGRST
jgi:trans-aconitate methyltransferase